MPSAAGSWVARLSIAAAAAAIMSCGPRASSSTAATPVDPNAPRVGAHFGTMGIEYVAANVAPGATIPGCGAGIAGCARRLTITFRLTVPDGAGTLVQYVAWLHGAGKIACLGTSPTFRAAAGTSVLVDALFDQTDAKCTLPFDATNLDIDADGGSATGRQEFGISYHFTQ